MCKTYKTYVAHIIYIHVYIYIMYMYVLYSTTVDIKHTKTHVKLMKTDIKPIQQISKHTSN